jgi:hypothetical protein
MSDMLRKKNLGWEIMDADVDKVLRRLSATRGGECTCQSWKRETSDPSI